MPNALFDRLTALSEPLRARILRVLAREELAVGELARVVQTSQPTISRHLKQLDAGGWVLRRKVGTATYYRLSGDELDPEARALWEVVAAEMEADAADPASLYAEDVRRLEGTLAQRTADSEELFRRLGGRWDGVRSELFGERFVPATVMALLPEGLRIADLGCGTGAMLPLLAGAAAHVVGVDREAAMIEVATDRTAGLPNVEIRRGLLDDLPLAPASVDLALCVLVLHHVRDLAPVFAEVARVLVPGGRWVVVDMAEHDREDYRSTMGHQHLGFAPDALAALAAPAGLTMRSWRVLPADAAATGPSLFVAAFAR